VDRIAQLITQFVCEELLRNKKKFSFETVFSDRSKLAIMDRANKFGYKTYLYFISTSHPEINKARVKIRVGQGGHDVPAKTIEDRYFRSLELFEAAIRLSYHSFIYDNTDESVMFAEYKIRKGRGLWNFWYGDIPDWFIKCYMERCGSEEIVRDIPFVLKARAAGVLQNPDRGEMRTG
jgi:predicted ABC-type ATPase